VTTLEYGQIDANHTKMKTVTPDNLRRLYKAGEMPLFDVSVSHSSIEHSGLRRYGDALNPWVDILTVMQAWIVSLHNNWKFNINSNPLPKVMDGFDFLHCL
jgi:Caenorhabditis protein of unknown function, DUF268